MKLVTIIDIVLVAVYAMLSFLAGHWVYKTLRKCRLNKRRDLFAGAAMQIFLQRKLYADGVPDQSPEVLSVAAVALADVLIAELEKKRVKT